MLRDHILKGYSANRRRLKELGQSLRVVSQVLDRYDVNSDQAKALLRVIAEVQKISCVFSPSSMDNRMREKR